MPRFVALLAVLLVGCEGVLVGPRSEFTMSDPIVPPVPPTELPPVIEPPPRVECGDARHAAATQGRRLTSSQYAHAIASIFNGKVNASPQYPGAYGKSLTGFSTEPSLGIVGQQSVDSILFAAEDVALALPAVLNELLPCASTTRDETCAGTYLSTMGRRAYRHTLSSEERSRLLARYRAARTEGATFAEGIALMTAQMLQAPQFVYVLEDAAVDARQLTPVELASRLSFLLWDSVPDDALLNAAEQGQLETPEAIAAQITRMLSATNADGTLARFVREWTHTTQFRAADKDPATYPFLNDQLARSVNESFDRFSADQLRTGTLTSLLTTRSMFVDAPLANMLGVTAPATGWSKVNGDAHRAGVSMQPALLAALSHAQNPSFIFRGKLVVEELLCQPLGSPPANAQSEFDSLPMPADPTGKEVGDAINTRAACVGCHRVLNPAGLAFENFDAVGRWQPAYRSGRAIDATGTLPSIPSSITFTDAEDLISQAAAQPRATACFGRQLFRFSFSRAETAADACALQTVDDALIASNGQLTAALVALATSDAFTWKVDP